MDHKAERCGPTADLSQIWYDSLNWPDAVIELADGKTRIKNFKLEKFPTAIGTLQLRLKIFNLRHKIFWLFDISNYIFKVDVRPI